MGPQFVSPHKLRPHWGYLLRHIRPYCSGGCVLGGIGSPMIQRFRDVPHLPPPACYLEGQVQGYYRLVLMERQMETTIIFRV